jgi:release factor glutamine methyltransferase
VWRPPGGEVVEAGQLTYHHRSNAIGQTAHQSKLEDTKGRVEHFADRLRPARGIQGLRHEQILRAMRENLTVGALLRLAAARLAERSESPRLDAELLLAHALGAPRSRLKAHPEEPVGEPTLSGFHQLVMRRAVGEPLAYLLGTKEFWTLRLNVNASVLIPRPETELLVERALEVLDADSPRTVVDLGTGSGAIALALASERPAWKVTATDSSPHALAVARANARALQLTRIEFVEGSWFEPLAGRRFDLIVSNPPYIGAGEPELFTLRFEPKAALSPGNDALTSLRKIIQEAPAHLERSGWVLLEHGSLQAAEVARELVARGFAHVRSHRDLAGQERVTGGRWCCEA